MMIGYSVKADPAHQQIVGAQIVRTKDTCKRCGREQPAVASPCKQCR